MRANQKLLNHTSAAFYSTSPSIQFSFNYASLHQQNVWCPVTATEKQTKPPSKHGLLKRPLEQAVTVLLHGRNLTEFQKVWRHHLRHKVVRP